ncbi:class I SAM-dependent methyltransferase [Aurantiacibacter aquimixticola]|uniref:Class I SAM-dependent methyltransferase n=1 Tax=Aurantiacibacter aquimixticola TaxID=1958945 RepID=A0A419RUC4_9SPHN|nr:SAM-dependent methyltransferase [Aurantiacibacter aquimixticola]RJY09388.1 class I SAM-dependent methyltransferase [Aurantiacibacter aquimixticola]
MGDPRDEHAKRNLGETFRRLIAATGPISLAHFMAESNARYYATREAIGGEGADFTTAPEISQMFGELIGLWLADMWSRAGSPDLVHYVELGPGRGTLARDALRAMKQHGLAPRVHLVETSPRMRDAQLQAVPDVVHHDDLGSIPADAPILLVANEFLDALPVRQIVRTSQGWREVMVGVDAEGAFAETPGRHAMDSAVPEERRSDPKGTVIETSPACAAVVSEVATRLAEQGGAALFIDYGYRHGRSGSTLQAVRNHQKVGVFDAPGEADLSAHVDFAQMALVARSQECKVFGTLTQGEFLTALGIDPRADALAASAPQHRDMLMKAKARLTASDQMGELFKVMGLAAPTWPDGAGFPAG